MSNTYDTSNLPLGTTAPKALYNNASNMDDAMNSEAPSWTDRFGRRRETFAGMEQEFDDFLQAAGYVDIGDYDLNGPLTITQRNQVFSHAGSYYRAGPSLVLPYTTVNNWTLDAPKFVLTGDAVLRSELGSSTGSSLVFDGSVSVADRLAVLRTVQFYATSTGGSSDALTAGFTPAIAVLENGRILYVRAFAPNSTINPTFTPSSSSIPAKVIVKGAGVPLDIGDISGAGFTAELKYDSTFDKWVLLNPANQVSKDLKASSINGGTVRGPGNPIINGAFDVWQLGTEFAVGPHLQKNADRWNYDFNGSPGTAFINRFQVPQGSKFTGFSPTYYLRFNQTIAGSGNTFQDVSTQIEDVGTLQDQVVTISFYATYLSGSPPTFTAIKTEQYFGSGGSPSSPEFTTSAPVTLQAGAGVWRRYSVTATLGSVAGKTLGTNADNTLNVIFTLPLNQVMDIGITCVQIEPGPIATPYQYRPVSQVYADCQRYLQTSYDDGVPPGTVTNTGAVALSTFSGTTLHTIPTRAAMRSFPAVTFYNPVTGAAGTWNQSGTPLPVSVNTGGHNNVTVAVASGVSGGFCIGHYVLQDPLI